MVELGTNDVLWELERPAELNRPNFLNAKCRHLSQKHGVLTLERYFCPRAVRASTPKFWDVTFIEANSGDIINMDTEEADGARPHYVVNEHFIVLSWAKGRNQMFTILDRATQKLRKFHVPVFPDMFNFHLVQESILVATSVGRIIWSGEENPIYVIDLDATSPADSLRVFHREEFSVVAPEDSGFVIFYTAPNNERVCKKSFETLGESKEKIKEILTGEQKQKSDKEEASTVEMVTDEQKILSQTTNESEMK